MPVSPPHRLRRRFQLALAVSILVHAIVLLVPIVSPPPKPANTSLTARFAPRPVAPRPRVEQAAVPPPSAAKTSPKKPAPTRPRRVITRADGGPSQLQRVPAEPKFTEAEKAEMDQFLKSLETDRPAKPSLAQSALAQARQVGREMARAEAREEARNARQGPVTIERIPDSPPVDPFSLEMYLDGLVNKLNRSSAFVQRETRHPGIKRGSAQLRLNPDGTLRSFEILNAADQQDELDFLARLVNKAAPYSPFPPDLVKSAKSMSILICILPPTESGGVGFTRKTDGKGC